MGHYVNSQFPAGSGRQQRGMDYADDQPPHRAVFFCPYSDNPCDGIATGRGNRRSGPSASFSRFAFGHEPGDGSPNRTGVPMARRFYAQWGNGRPATHDVGAFHRLANRQALHLARSGSRHSRAAGAGCNLGQPEIASRHPGQNVAVRAQRSIRATSHTVSDR